MKIIKEGVWDEPWSLRVRCANSGCGAELEVTVSDLVPPIGDTAHYSYGCPKCSFRNLVAPEKIQLGARERVEPRGPALDPIDY